MNKMQSYKCNHVQTQETKYSHRVNMIKCDHMMLVKMLPMIIDKIKV